MKLNYWIFYGLAVICAVLFVFWTKENGNRNFIFLGLAIGALLRGMYEMNKDMKTKNQSRIK
jgi:membrane protease YdiL (CAAX protease family)